MCAKTLVHTLFPRSLNPMGQKTDTIGERSGRTNAFAYFSRYVCETTELPNTGLIMVVLLGKRHYHFLGDAGFEPIYCIALTVQSNKNTVLGLDDSANYGAHHYLLETLTQTQIYTNVCNIYVG